MRRTAVALVLAVSVLSGAALAGCSSEGGDGDALPPASKAALVRALEPRIARFGLRFTRAGLQDTETYEYTPDGRHLALYVEPSGSTFGTDGYLRGLAGTAKALIPYALERWPGLRSVDVCQEPLPSVDASETPRPVTTVIATRKGSDALDWDSADNAHLLALGFRDPVNFTVRVASEVSSTPEYRVVLDEARRLRATSGS